MNADTLLKHFDRISEAPGAVARLRHFILDLAVRGKLVEQDSNDEPAAELLKRITAITGPCPNIEKGQEEKRAFALPPGWAWSRVGLLTTKTGSGSTPRGGQAAYQSTGVPFLRSQNVYNDGLRLNEVAYIDQGTHARMSGTAVQPGDLLLNITGGSIGRCCHIPDAPIEANISQHVAIIRPAESGMGAFLHKVVLSPFFQSFVVDEQTGAGRGGLPKNRMDQIAVPVPPLAEQHRIVAKVDELMALCDQLQAANNGREARRDRLVAASLHRIGNAPAVADQAATETQSATSLRDAARFHLDHLPRFTARPEHIKQLRQTILNLAVRGRLVAQDPNDEPAVELLNRLMVKSADEAPFPIPESWRWIAVGEIGISRLGKMLDKAKNKGTLRRYLRNVNVRWLDFDLSDVYEMPFEDGELDEFALRAGDVLICEGGEPGRAAVWDGRETGIYFQKAIHRVRFSEGVDSHFFVNALRESADNGRLSTYFTGVGIKHFTGKGLSSFIFPLPPLAEQQRIVAKVDELMALCDQLETQLAKSAADSRRLLEALLRDALAPALEQAA